MRLGKKKIYKQYVSVLLLAWPGNALKLEDIGLMWWTFASLLSHVNKISLTHVKYYSPPSLPLPLPLSKASLLHLGLGALVFWLYYLRRLRKENHKINFHSERHTHWVPLGHRHWYVVHKSRRRPWLSGEREAPDLCIQWYTLIVTKMSTPVKTLLFFPF